MERADDLFDGDDEDESCVVRVVLLQLFHALLLQQQEAESRKMGISGRGAKVCEQQNLDQLPGTAFLKRRFPRILVAHTAYAA